MLYCYDVFQSRVRIKETMSRNQSDRKKNQNEDTNKKKTMTSNCFICGESFLRAELSAHEKTCLQSIQTTQVQYTRQNTDDTSDSLTFLTNNDSSSFSNHSSGSSSNEGNDKKTHRCYICGTDIPIYLKSIHEKNCKKSWESGLLNSIATPGRLSNSKKDLLKDSSELKKSKAIANIISSSNLKKSRSTSYIPKDLKSDISRAESASDLLKSRVGSLSLNKQKSHSSANLFKSNSEQKDFLTNYLSIGNRKLSYEDTEKKPPQYVECFICGKQYSTHSIDIHQKQCIQTRTFQLDAGVVPAYRKKSKSLADIRLKANVKSISPSKQIKKIDNDERRFSAIETSKQTVSNHNLVNSTLKSSSTSNLNKIAPMNKTSVDIEVPANPPQINPGFQECRICTQLYGSRSLPIHEKQCLKKFELARQEDEKLKKRTKANKNFNIIPFGHSQDVNDSDLHLPKGHDRSSPNTSESNSEFFLKNTNSLKANEDEIKPELVSKDLKRISLKLCVYCNLKFGQSSILIHEKSCREKCKEIADELFRKNDSVVKNPVKNDGVITNGRLESILTSKNESNLNN
ncbi:uncharacterized protein LOC100207093 isoform X1 [Hydra vulgaris]|uniref:uncharacterized protein LOC100207093 isoform X1 n=1 Tax=Hydra vulgaris TaxID=6087 RepID=UPI001F5EF1AF|nr:uncharacterized protein LOC100207093 isoform X2 [Hydra vulgaris]